MQINRLIKKEDYSEASRIMEKAHMKRRLKLLMTDEICAFAND